jgi:glycosyltransferase involved in cell wall biosynthesis
LLTTSEEQIQDCQRLILQKHAEQTVWTRFINTATATIPHNLEPVVETYRKIKTSRSILGRALFSRELDIQLGITTGSSSVSPLDRAAAMRSESQTEFSQETSHAEYKAAPGPPASIDKPRAQEIATISGTASALETPCSAGNNAINPYVTAARNAFRKLSQYWKSFWEVVREQGLRRALTESYLFLVAALFPARAILWRGSYSGDEFDSLYGLTRSHVETLLSCAAPTETESTIRKAIAILLSGHTECRLVAFSDLESLYLQWRIIEEVRKGNDSKPLIFLRMAFGQQYCLRVSENAIETNAILAVLNALGNIKVELVAFTPLIEPLLDSLRVSRFSYDTRLLRINGLANSGLALASHSRLAKFDEEPFQIHQHQIEGRPAWQADRDLLNTMKPIPIQVSDANTPQETDGLHGDGGAVFAFACCEPLDERLDWAQFLRLPVEVRRRGVLFVGRCSLTLPIGPESAAPDAVKRTLIASENASVFPTFISTLGCWLKLCWSVVSHPDSASLIARVLQAHRDNNAHDDKKLFLARQFSEVSPVGARATRCLAIIQNVTFFDWTGERFLNGGAERYVLDLADLLSEEGFEVILAQGAASSFEKRHGDYVVSGIPVGSQHVFRELSRKANELFKDACLFIASPLELAMCIRGVPAIGINHGVHWDHKRNSVRNYEVQRFDDVLAALNRCTAVVAVDTNFINWLRTVDYGHAQRVVFVPNYVDLKRFVYTEKNFEGALVCLYPRRLYEARGLQITARAFDRLLLTFGDLSLHFVGQVDSDADVEIVMELQRRYGARILWEERLSNEMPDVYRKAHVAVIPTMYSEGTSLSCLEAMASNCCVIVTDVGGLPNLVVNGYNGFVIKPKASDLFAVMQVIYRNRRLVSETARRGREVATAFDKHNWEKRWRAIIRQVTG